MRNKSIKVNNKKYILVFTMVFKMLVFCFLISSCKCSYNHSINPNTMKIEDIPQNAYENLYLSLKDNSDKNIIIVYCKNPDYYNYRYDCE